MNTGLLDVNVLVALTDPQHMHHEAAHGWWMAGGSENWATCPITENGFVRVSSHPSYPNRPGDAVVVLATLRRLCDLPGHRFWPDDVSLRDALTRSVALTHGQVTDAYLLSLAVHHSGYLVTFDRRVQAAIVPGGADATLVIPA